MKPDLREKRKWVTLAANISLAFFSCVFLLTVLETGFRAYDAYLDYRYPEEKKGSGLWEYDSLLGWKMKANIQTYYSKKKDRFRIPVRTNSKGLRDEDYAYEKSAKAKRILLLGDSVVVGLEVLRQDVIDVKLEELLRRHGNYEVINTGNHGYGTDQQYLYLTHEGYKYSPDIIIHVAVKNDPTENITIHQRQRPFGKAYFGLDDKGQLVLKGMPIPKFKATDPWVMSREDAKRYYGNQGEEGEPVTQIQDRSQPANLTSSLLASLKQDFSNLFIYRWFRDRIKGMEGIKNLLIQWKILSRETSGVQKPEALKAYEYQIQKKLLEAMRDLAQSINAKFLVYEFTNGRDRMPEIPTNVQKICQSLGIQYFNSFNAFQTAHGKPVYCYRYDGHWNAKGHQLAAESIYQFLLEKKWL